MTAAIGLHDEPEGHDSHETATFGHHLQGTVLAGTYRLGRCIGAGGSSHVFEAEHLRLGRKFAVKVLRAELDGKRAAARFRREAVAIARLRSEHVVSVIDCGELDEHTPYLVMELLEGEDLRRLLAHAAPLPARRAVHLAIEACCGLSEVHQAGLVHRDLKPENLFITRRSTGKDWCKILDFGVAKMEASIGTAHGAIVGTVRYMAPEQLGDSSAIGPATDIHAIGAILFECLTGRPLVRGASVQEAMFQIINASPRQLLAGAELPDRLERVIATCLEKSPASRPASAAELAQLLAATVETPVSLTDSTLADADDDRTRRGAPRPPRQRSWTLACGALSTTLVGVFLGWQVSPRNVAEGAPAPASTPADSDTLLPRASGALLQEQPSADSTPAPPASHLAVTSAAPSPAKPASASPKRRARGPTAPPADAMGPLERFDRANPYGD